MDTFEAIAARRAVKHYDPNHELTDEEVDKLVTAALQAPTAFNIQNWRFVVVKDKALREQIPFGGNRAAAELVGKAIAERALAADVRQVAFDRREYKYHGRVAALANAVRDVGLDIGPNQEKAEPQEGGPGRRLRQAPRADPRLERRRHPRPLPAAQALHGPPVLRGAGGPLARPARVHRCPPGPGGRLDACQSRLQP